MALMRVKKTTFFMVLALFFPYGANASSVEHELLPTSVWSADTIEGYQGRGCRVSRQYEQNIDRLIFHFYEQDWADVFIAFKTPSFQPGTIYNVSFTGREGYREMLDAQAISSTRLVVKLNNPDNILSAMQYVQGVDVHIAGQPSYGFRNPNQEGLFDQLSQCFGREAFNQYHAQDTAPSGGESQTVSAASSVKLSIPKEGVVTSGLAKSAIKLKAPIKQRSFEKVVLKPFEDLRPSFEKKMQPPKQPSEEIRVSARNIRAEEVVGISPSSGEKREEQGREVQTEWQEAVSEEPEFERMSRFPKRESKRPALAKQNTPPPVQNNRALYVETDHAAELSAAQEMERAYRKSPESQPQKTVENTAEDSTGASGMFKKVLDKVAGKKIAAPVKSSKKADLYGQSALDVIRAKPKVIDLSESCNVDVPEAIEPLRPYLAGNSNNFDEQELVESLKEKMQILEREKEALRQGKPEQPGPLSVVRVCSQEKNDVEALAKRLGVLESQNFELSQLQNDLNAIDGAAKDFENLQSNIDELMSENAALQKSMQEMQARMNEMTLKNGTDQKGTNSDESEPEDVANEENPHDQAAIVDYESSPETGNEQDSNLGEQDLETSGEQTKDDTEEESSTSVDSALP